MPSANQKHGSCGVQTVAAGNLLFQPIDMVVEHKLASAMAEHEQEQRAGAITR